MDNNLFKCFLKLAIFVQVYRNEYLIRIIRHLIRNSCFRIASDSAIHSVNVWKREFRVGYHFQTGYKKTLLIRRIVNDYRTNTRILNEIIPWFGKNCFLPFDVIHLVQVSTKLRRNAIKRLEDSIERRFAPDKLQLRVRWTI